MSLGLSHSLSRHKLKFSPDKVDTMIIQAIALLDDLDKELNIYAMRVKEWYGWHFPEMARIVNDNLAYARIIIAMGMRTSAVNADLAEILPEEIETAVKAAAEVSMGTEITSEDLDNIQGLAEQVVSFTDQRAQLSNYLSARMAAVAPNLTALVGDLVGARLIAHAGSLMNLAKSPASTVQILGAEKALFRALKTKHDTPKYGLIYHASLIGQATGKNKGKIARILSAKAAMGLRIDALAETEGDNAVAEEERSAFGLESRQKVERRLASLEGKPLRSKGVAIAPNGALTQPGRWEVKEARKYNPDADGLAGDEPAAIAALSKQSKKDKPEGLKQLIQEVKEDPKAQTPKSSDSEEDVASDVEMGDRIRSDSPDPSKKGSRPYPSASTKAMPKANGAPDGNKSETISMESDDKPDSPGSPAPQEKKLLSSIPGDTKAAKKAQKKERRHERKLASSEPRGQERKEGNEKTARRLDRKERHKGAEQKERREVGEDEQYAILAEQAGLSVVRYKRKLARGEIKFDADGKPMAISKKDIKKAKKAAEKKGDSRDLVTELAAVRAEGVGKKRKRGEEEEGDELEVEEQKLERKRKKKAAAANLKAVSEVHSPIDRTPQNSTPLDSPEDPVQPQDSFKLLRRPALEVHKS
ncbi:MAG: hypothetical protein Q9216_003901, partial [Gyalolechia sp. 2 TL-2023]